MNLRVRSWTVEETAPLLGLLAAVRDEHRFAFVRDGDGLVAWGVAARVEVGSGAGRFARADEGLRELSVSADVDDGAQAFGSGLIAFGSFAFDEEAEGSILLVPRVVIGRRDGRMWRTEITTDPLSTSSTESIAVIPRHVDVVAPVDRPRYAGSSVSEEDWLESIGSALAEIDAGRLEKVVLARDQLLWSQTAFDIDRILDTLATTFPGCSTFLVEGLLGASPELLLSLRGSEVVSEVLAGTAPRGLDVQEDGALAEGLLASRKDLEEHRLAVESVADVLGARLGPVDRTAPRILRLANVQHLATRLEARCGHGARSLLLAGDLHPTAAVGGTPRAEALAMIRALEGMDRDRYAAPVGWTGADGQGEWAIALRCASISGRRARLFAGAGVVAGSRPADELRETWMKLEAMRAALDVSTEARAGAGR